MNFIWHLQPNTYFCFYTSNITTSNKLQTKKTFSKLTLAWLYMISKESQEFALLNTAIA